MGSSAALLLAAVWSAAPGADEVVWFPRTPRQGSLVVAAGMHRAAFAGSSLHLAGEGYELTVDGIEAHDIPEIDSTGFQYNLRVGWFVTDRVSASLAWTHMKYQIDAPQSAAVSGFVRERASARHAGEYARAVQQVGTQEDMIGNVEHTDGLNLFALELGYTRDLVAIGAHVVVAAVLASSAGPVVTRTCHDRFGEHYREDYRLAGLAVGATAGLRLEVFEYAYADVLGNVGWAAVIDAIDAGRLSQDIGYLSAMFLLGARIPL